MAFLLYTYTRRSTNRGYTRIYWRCIEREICNGTVSTNYNAHNGIYLVKGKPHSHEADFVEIRVQVVVRAIKRKVEEHYNAPPSSIFKDEVATVANDNKVIMMLPQRKNN